MRRAGQGRRRAHEAGPGLDVRGGDGAFGRTAAAASTTAEAEATNHRRPLDRLPGVREKTRAGLVAARAQGRGAAKGEAPRVLLQAAALREFQKDGSQLEVRRPRGAGVPRVASMAYERAVNEGDTTQARTASKRGASSAWRAEIEKSSRATSSPTRRTRPTRRGRARRSGAGPASFFQRRGDGVTVDATQARSHGQGESKARADRRRAVSHRRRAAPGRDETRRGVARRATSTGRNVSTAPEPPDVAVLGGRQAAAISTISPRARRDARPEARRRPRGVLLQAAPRRAVPRVHPRDGRRVAGVQKGGARAAAAAEADVLPRPGLSLFFL